MGFNYAREKRRFDNEWRLLEEQYREAGFNEAGVRAMRDYDWSWFKQRRTYANRVQPLPSEDIDNTGENHSTLLSKFDNLIVCFDETSFLSAYSWIVTISDPVLSDKLSNLSEADKKLLTLLVFCGYSQSEIAEKLDCVQSVISRKMLRVKKYLR